MNNLLCPLLVSSKYLSLSQIFKKSQIAHLKVPLLEGLKTLSGNFWLFSLLTYQINSEWEHHKKILKLSSCLLLLPLPMFNCIKIASTFFNLTCFFFLTHSELLKYYKNEIHSYTALPVFRIIYSIPWSIVTFLGSRCRSKRLSEWALLCIQSRRLNHCPVTA